MYLDLGLAIFFIISASLFWLIMTFLFLALITSVIASLKSETPPKYECPEEIDKDLEELTK